MFWRKQTACVGGFLCRFFTISFLCVFSGIPLYGRTWTSESGSFSVEADLVEVKDDAVVLKKENGHVIRVPLAKLSEADREFAEKHADKSDADDDADVFKNVHPKAKQPSDASDATEKTKPAKKTEDAQVGAFHIDQQVRGRTFWESLVTYNCHDATEKEFALKYRQDPTTTVAMEIDKRMGFEVYVPKDYTPDTPYGVLTFVSSGDDGRIPEAMKVSFAKHHLIYIGGNGIGNKAYVPFRQAKAIESIRLIVERYTLDFDRIYIAGLSGGGRLASQAMISASNIFTGGIPIVGCNPYSMVKGLTPAALMTAKRQGRYAFITGDADFNRDETKKLAEQYTREGFAHISYFQVPGMSHGMAPAEWLEKALVAIDEPLKLDLKKQFDNGLRAERSRRFGEALCCFTRAAMHDPSQPFADKAKEHFAELHGKYLTEIEKVENGIADRKFAEATKHLTELKRWTPYSTTAIAALTDKLADAKRNKNKKE